MGRPVRHTDCSTLFRRTVIALLPVWVQCLNNKLQIKTAVFSHLVPPAVSGTAVRIYRLFQSLDPASYCIITSRDIGGADDLHGRMRLPCTYHRLPSEWRRIKGPASGRWSPIFDWLNVWLKVVQRGRNLARVLKSENCRTILAYSGDLEDIPAAWWAARKAGCALILVFDDDYLNQWTDPVKHHCARLVEPWVVRAAAGIFTISEFGRDEYIRRYGVSSTVLHSLAPENVGAPPNQVLMRYPPEPVKILFTGSVYHANYDAIMTLIKGLKMMSDCKACLHIYTPQSPVGLDRQGISGPLVVHPIVDPSQIGAIQTDADILFLPLGFCTHIPEVLRTACPAKLADYLVSGRPILAYAPPNSFLAWFVRKNGCALLVDQADPRAISEAILRLQRDPELRLQLVQHAYTCAAKTFNGNINRKVFVDHINEWSQAPHTKS